MKGFVAIILLTFICLGAQGQGVGKNWRIDPKRYEDIKGSPYYYDEPIAATLSLHKGKKPFKVMLNVNMYEGMVEVYKEENDVLIPFAQVISIESDEHPSLLFIDNRLIAFPFTGESYQLSDELTVALQIKELYPPGQIIRKKRFIRKDKYSLTLNGRDKKIKLSNKSVKRVLGKDAYLLAQQNDLDLGEEEDLIALLEMIEGEL